ncbi:hypothetical protein JXL21_10850 [Candidatus Bathyarchaeota archaeon]|nr:hypothetical protein [Candidatus Bathyarchaeota archaeon]
MSVDCMNKPVNLDHCVCTSTDCERKGLCCQCVANHRAHGNLPACLRPTTD